MIRKTVNLGRFKPKQTASHVEPFGTIIKSASQTCNCTDIAINGNELSFTLVMPDIPKDVLQVYGEEFVEEGVPMIRRIIGKLVDGNPFELIINFSLYALPVPDPA